jgi:AraC-like DNA-binding protein
MQRVVKIRHYVGVMESMGYLPVAVLEGTGIGADKLAEPGYVIEIRQCKTVVANMIRLTGNQGIGFKVGDRLRMVDLGILAHAMLSSRTLRHAIDLWVRYDGTLAGMLIHLEVTEEDGGDWSFTINEIVPLGFLFNFCIEEVLMIMVRFGITLTGKPLLMKRIRLSYPAPSHELLYRQAFDCPVEFNSERTCVTFASLPVNEPLQTNDDELNEVCEARCQQIFRQIAGESPVSARLRSQLLKKSSPLPSLGEAADLMGMSPRNLHRQLAREGVTYRGVLNDLRIELAKEYLGSGQFLPKEIGYLLGFKDPNVFRRAFKSWTGQTVTEYRTSRGHPDHDSKQEL